LLTPSAKNIFALNSEVRSQLQRHNSNFILSNSIFHTNLYLTTPWRKTVVNMVTINRRLRIFSRCFLHNQTKWLGYNMVQNNCETIATFKKHLDCLLKNRGYIIYKLFSFFPLVKPLFSFGVVVELSSVEKKINTIGRTSPSHQR